MSTLRWRTLVILVVIGASLQAGASLLAAAESSDVAPGQPAAPGKAALPPPGRPVYLAECAACHGVQGDGQGPAAKFFAQRPTDFTKGIYKLRSTLSSSPGSDLPADADLRRTIRDGMSGSEMVPFRDVLSAKSIAAVAQYLKTLSDRFADPSFPNPETSVVNIPQRPFPASAESVAAGQAVYKNLNCADCHGERGEGNPDEKDKAGFPVRMVSFRLGYYKSGTSERDLYRTIATGMRGTTMDFYGGSTSEQELWQLVDYVRSLAEPPTGLVGKVWHFLIGEQPSGLMYPGAASSQR